MTSSTIKTHSCLAEQPAVINVHSFGDGDAYAAAYFIKRFLCGSNATIVFTATDVATDADFIADKGMVYDPSNGRYDHHQIDGNVDSAISLIYGAMCELDSEAQAYSQIVRIITKADLGQMNDPEVSASSAFGYHGLIANLKSQRNADGRPWNDEQIYAEVEVFLGRMVDTALFNYRNEKSFAQWTDVEFDIKGHKAVQLSYGAPNLSFVAYDKGFDIVFFEGDAINKAGQTVYARGINTTNGVHAGEMIQKVIDTTTNEAVKAELSKWFQHKAGFFAGISPMATGVNETPMSVSMDNIIMEIIKAG